MNKDIIERTNELIEEIAKLPKGYISVKNIGGNIYYYHQWNENGKKISKYISDDEVINLDNLIKKRQQLEQELKVLKKGHVSSFTLMHLNEKVVDLFFDDNGYIKAIGTVYAIKHLPIGSINEKGNINSSNLLEWWNDRSIPLSRSGIREAIEELGINSPQSLLLKCFGLSLSDQFWIKPKNDGIKWEDINFFHHDFSDDVGELLLSGKISNKDLDLSSPDSTSVGNLKKRWKIVDNNRVLIKGGSNPFRQEPYNEVVASRILDVLDIPHIPYSLLYIDEYPYSECEDFIKDNQDLVPAHLINKILKKNNSDSSYIHLLKCASKLNIPGFLEYIDKLIVFDFIIANEDRHFNNFGAIRDAKTLEFIGPSPIFDSGASFGYNKIESDIKPFKDIEAKPFKSNILEQLKLVSSFDWLDVNKLNYIKNNLYDWFIELESKYLNKNRIDAIVDSTIRRIDYLIEQYR